MPLDKCELDVASRAVKSHLAYLISKMPSHYTVGEWLPWVRRMRRMWLEHKWKHAYYSNEAVRLAVEEYQKQREEQR